MKLTFLRKAFWPFQLTQCPGLPFIASTRNKNNLMTSSWLFDKATILLSQKYISILPRKVDQGDLSFRAKHRRHVKYEMVFESFFPTLVSYVCLVKRGYEYKIKIAEKNFKGDLEPLRLALLFFSPCPIRITLF